VKLKCIIVDDEFLAREYLKDYVSKVSFLELLGDFNSPLKAIEMLQSGEVDLMFLDIQMPDISGIEFLRTQAKYPEIIITTAYKDYALEGYELNVTDYLLKPFSFERFFKAVNKVLEKKNQSLPTVEKQPDEKTAETTIHDDYLIIRADRKHYRIIYSDIEYIEGQKAYVTFHTAYKKITALASLRDLEEQLPADQFIRIHKSYIASKAKITALEGNILELQQVKLPVGSSYRDKIASFFGLSE